MKNEYIAAPIQILNERKWIDYIVEHDYIDLFKPGWTLKLYAKHLIYDLGYGKNKTVDTLERYARDHAPHLTIFQSRRAGQYDRLTRVFNSYYRSAAESPICEIDGIWITENELVRISELHNKVLERFAFTLLCYAKLFKMRNEKADGWVYHNLYMEIKKIAKLDCSYNDSLIMLHKLNEFGLIDFRPEPTQKDMDYYAGNLQAYQKYMQSKTDVRVNFMDFDSKGIIYVDDWRELGNYYRRYRGENIGKCERCGVLMRTNKNHTKKYCSECKKQKPQYAHVYRCVDCKKLFYYNPTLGERPKKRCPECKINKDKEHNRIMYQKRKAKMEIDNSTN